LRPGRRRGKPQSREHLRQCDSATANSNTAVTNPTANSNTAVTNATANSNTAATNAATNSNTAAAATTAPVNG